MLMDEPLSSLDSSRRAEIMPVIEYIRDELKHPILYVSHDRGEVERLATQIVQLEPRECMRRSHAGTDTRLSTCFIGKVHACMCVANNFAAGRETLKTGRYFGGGSDERSEGTEGGRTCQTGGV